MRLIDADALLIKVDEEREYLKARGLFGAEHILTKDFRNLIEDAPTAETDFTDLEQEVITDAINYLLGAELLEENGYTEEVINALKSVLQKIGAEENRLRGRKDG